MSDFLNRNNNHAKGHPENKKNGWRRVKKFRSGRRKKERPEGVLPTPLSSGANFTHELYISVIGLKITFCQESVANVIRRLEI